MSGISPTTVIEVEKIATALRIGAGFNWKGAIAAFEGEDTQTKILDGMILADDAASIVGLFLPPANAVAIGLGVAIAVEPTAYQFLSWVAKQPVPKKMIGDVAVWGETTRAGILQAVTGWWKANVTSAFVKN